MRKLGLLLKVQLLGMFGLNRVIHAGSARDKARLAGLGMVFALVGVLAVAYAYGTGAGLVMLGAAEAVPVLAVVAGSLVGVLVTFLKANGLLFGFKDFDLTMSLPVPLWQVAVSRVAALYGMNLLWAALLMVPLFAAALPALGLGAGAWAAALATVALAPLAPMALTVALAFGLAAAASRARHGRMAAGVIGIVATLALVVAIAAAAGATGTPPAAGAPSGLAEDVAALGQIGALVSESAAALWPPAAWAAAAIVAGSPAALAAFAALSLGAMAACIALLARFLVPINSLLAGGARARAARARREAPRSPLRALVQKELRAVASTPVWLMNTAIGPVLALVAGVAFLVVGPDATALLAAAVHVPGVSAADVEPLVAGALMALVPWVLAFCAAMAPMSASALSLEGDARWIMQTAPQPPAAIMGAKILANVVLAAPAVALAGALAAIGLRATPLEAAALVALPVAAALLTSALGAFLNGRMPRYDWTSEYEPVKRSVPVMATIFIGLALAALGALATLAAASAAAGVAAAPAGTAAAAASIAAGASAAAADAGAISAPAAPLVQLAFALLLTAAAILLSRQAARANLKG
ncbi:hypothetical protein [Adlercreutzia faecimuris]|uniref:ABC-2 type transport system permease protein n=1 Tax=Adlercreutzia faecimuris TaxID=2897341 RepID=A0ABS9WDP5_9ACTN|nr:hypothetical protein [Adlercreutzia sp. JBNU-10]MCI2240985.1 hypothetical protein [Adlercreutzia sp. JBNU-10]